jgi:hypothetical protein
MEKQKSPRRREGRGSGLFVVRRDKYGARG